MAISKFLPIQIQLLVYFKSLYLIHLIGYCINKGNLHFSFILKGSLSGKYLVITLTKLKLKILYRNFCLSKRQGAMVPPLKRHCETFFQAGCHPHMILASTQYCHHHMSSKSLSRKILKNLIMNSCHGLGYYPKVVILILAFCMR